MRRPRTGEEQLKNKLWVEEERCRGYGISGILVFVWKTAKVSKSFQRKITLKKTFNSRTSWFPRTALTKCHKLCGLNNINGLFHTVPEAGSLRSGVGRAGSVWAVSENLLRPLSLPCGGSLPPVSSCGRSSVHICLCATFLLVIRVPVTFGLELPMIS